MGVEGQDQHLLDAVALHKRAALGGRTQQQRRAFWRDHLGRMRTEGERRWFRPALARQPDYGSHQCVVRGVDAIEVTDGDGGGCERSACLFETAKNPHDS